MRKLWLIKEHKGQIELICQQEFWFLKKKCIKNPKQILLSIHVCACITVWICVAIFVWLEHAELVFFLAFFYSVWLSSLVCMFMDTSKNLKLNWFKQKKTRYNGIDIHHNYIYFVINELQPIPAFWFLALMNQSHICCHICYRTTYQFRSAFFSVNSLLTSQSPFLH